MGLSTVVLLKSHKVLGMAPTYIFKWIRHTIGILKRYCQFHPGIYSSYMDLKERVEDLDKILKADPSMRDRFGLF
jgi:hypothetical protein